MPTKTKPKHSPLQGAIWPIVPFFRATLPLPPGINASYKTNGSAQFYGSPALHEFKQEAELMLKQQWSAQDWVVIGVVKESKVKVPLELNVDFYFKTLWRKDIDGGIKAVQDVIFNHLGLNDNLVVRLPVEKWADADNPRCEISLSVCLERIG